jgi:hypothetical protein
VIEAVRDKPAAEPFGRVEVVLGGLDVDRVDERLHDPDLRRKVLVTHVTT